MYNEHNEENKVSEANEQNKVSEVNEQNKVNKVNKVSEVNEQNKVSEVDEQIENVEQELEENDKLFEIADDTSFEIVSSSEDIEKLLKSPIKGLEGISINRTLVEEILKGDEKANNSLQKLYEKHKSKDNGEHPMFVFHIYLYNIKFEKSVLKSVPLYKLVPETHLNINLQLLIISDCNINSYEYVCLFEKLKILYLYKNNVGSMKFFAKSNFKELRDFSIVDCSISSTERMYRARLGKLKYVDIDTDFYSNMAKNLSVDLCDLIKLNGDSIESINFKTGHPAEKDIGILGCKGVMEKRFSKARININEPL